MIKTLEEIHEEVGEILFHRWEDEAKHFYINQSFSCLTLKEYEANYIQYAFRDWKAEQRQFKFRFMEE